MKFPVPSSIYRYDLEACGQGAETKFNFYHVNSIFAAGITDW